MLLVPVPGRRHSRELTSKLFVSFWRELQSNSGFGRLFHIMTAATQPKASEDLSLQSEGQDVIAKRLIFGHTVE